MAVISVHSSEESSGPGGGGMVESTSDLNTSTARARVAAAVGENVASPSSVSLAFLEGSDPGEGESVPPSRDGDRIINGIAIFLLHGGVQVNREMVEPTGGWPRIRGYHRASPDVDMYTSNFGTREDL